MNSVTFYDDIEDVKDGLSGKIDHYSVGNLRSLIRDGLDINDQDEEGNTLLHQYVDDNLFYPVKLLCEVGAKRDIKNSKGLTPIQIAEKRKEYFHPARIYGLLLSFDAIDAIGLESEKEELKR